MADLETVKAHIYSKENAKKACEAMKALLDSTNIMGGDKDVVAGMLEGLLSTHKTLQQSFFRCFVETMKHYKDTPFRDLRNDASVEFAKKIAEMDDIYFPYV